LLDLKDMTDNKDNNIVVRKQTPKQITNFGHKAAKQLIDIVKQNSQWSLKIQNNDYLRFEAWQTLARFFGYTIKTEKTNFIELGEASGFEATSSVLDSTGMVIGGAEAVCMNDEKNWKDKPLYALKSMAQTRASARALRQILSWVVVLAGYKPTPAEEIGLEVEEDIKREKQIDSWNGGVERPASESQKKMIFAVAKQKGLDTEKVKETIKEYFKIEHFEDLTLLQAKKAIDNLLKKPSVETQEV
jgi:hypothetical protein